MKHLSLFKNVAMACGTLATVVALSSCHSATSPSKAANRLATGTDVTIFSHNDANSPRNRDCREAGPIPARAARALDTWLRNSTVKSFSYAYPQYYLAMADPKTGRQSSWGICSDGQGNLVGVLIPRSGVMAWDLPPVGEYKMYVCDTQSRQGLSHAIMDSLADAGYDTYRIDSRKARGITQQRYLISKPLSDAAQKRLDELKKMEQENQKASEAKKAAAAASAEDEEEESGDSKTEEATPASDIDELDLDNL